MLTPLRHRVCPGSRVNPRVINAQRQGLRVPPRVRSACEHGSRWRRFALTYHDQYYSSVGKKLRVARSDHGSLVLSIDGRSRTEVPLSWKDAATLNATGKTGLPGRATTGTFAVCSVEERVGGIVRLMQQARALFTPKAAYPPPLHRAALPLAPHVSGAHAFAALSARHLTNHDNCCTPSR